MTNAGLEELAAGAGDPSFADGASTRPVAGGDGGFTRGAAPAVVCPRSTVDDTRGAESPGWATTPMRLLRLLAVAPLLTLVWLYRTLISPVLPPACRYDPSCAAYAEEALRAHGPLRGSWLSLARLLRCHPWCVGGPDPVPPRRSRPALSRFQ